ncbi:MAG TPA: GntR family transcriptional regulator [Actinomycetota bacterium]|nr:GntR family transcriptional regulator [Actinomycetota bacterium]
MTTALAPISRRGHLPFYVQLAQILRDHIAAGGWAPGEAIPSEADLGSLFGVSRTVVRQALGELVAEGLVQKEKGRGTFVSRPKIAQFTVQEVRGFHEEMTQRGQEVRTQVLSQGLASVPPEAAPELGVPMGSQCVSVERVRRVSGEPVVLVQTFLPLPRFASVVDADLTDASLYELLTSRFGVRPCGGVRSIEATSATHELVEHLGVEFGDPILRVTATNLDGEGVPFEWFRAWYRADRTTLQVRIGPAT